MIVSKEIFKPGLKMPSFLRNQRPWMLPFEVPRVCISGLWGSYPSAFVPSTAFMYLNGPFNGDLSPTHWSLSLCWIALCFENVLLVFFSMWNQKITFHLLQDKNGLFSVWEPCTKYWSLSWLWDFPCVRDVFEDMIRGVSRERWSLIEL